MEAGYLGPKEYHLSLFLLSKVLFIEGSIDLDPGDIGLINEGPPAVLKMALHGIF